MGRTGIEPVTLGSKVPENCSCSLPLLGGRRHFCGLFWRFLSQSRLLRLKSAWCAHGALGGTLLIVAASRALRRLVPDADLVRRRAAGESLRSLAADYAVAHTTLGRYLARKDAAADLRAARRSLQAEGRAAKARRLAERQIERTVRRQAKQEAALARSFSESDVPPRRSGHFATPRGSTNAMHGGRCSARTCSAEAMSSRHALRKVVVGSKL